MITFKVKGDYKHTLSFLKKSKKLDIRDLLEECGKRGVAALAQATPKDTGLTANSWEYNINNMRVSWTNTNVVNGVSVAILLQYGHATRSGSYIEGIDYINPAIKPIFDDMVKQVDLLLKGG
jgi:hypothetical protein